MKVLHFPDSDEGCYRAVWLAVIHQALVDMVCETETPELLKLSEAARKWFFTSNKGFYNVCRMAGLDPMFVRKQARAIQTNPEHFNKGVL